METVLKIAYWIFAGVPALSTFLFGWQNGDIDKESWELILLCAFVYVVIIVLGAIIGAAILWKKMCETADEKREAAERVNNAENTAKIAAQSAELAHLHIAAQKTQPAPSV